MKPDIYSDWVMPSPAPATKTDQQFIANQGAGMNFLGKTSIVAFAAAGLAYPTAAIAQTNDWYVYSSASARARDVSGGRGQVDNECNGPSATCRASAGFVGDHSDTLTRASSAAAAVGYNPTYSSASNPRGVAVARAVARADLTTGEIGIGTAAEGVGGELTSSGAQATIFDTIFFDLGGAAAPVTITVDLRVDGTFEGFVQPRYGFALSGQLGTLSTGTVGWSDGNVFGPVSTQTADFIDFGGYTGRGGSWSIYGPDRFVGTFVIDPRNPFATLGMYLSAGGSTEYGDTQSSFEHTAAVKFSLPEGVSFTSASGSFLSASGATGAVPEPASWAMIIGGFGFIGSALRRQRATRIVAAS